MSVDIQYDILLLIVLVLSILEVFNIKFYSGKGYIFVLISILLVLFCGFRPLDFDRDVGLYKLYFNTFCSYSYTEIFFDNPHRVKEVGFILLNKFFCTTGFRSVLLTCAIIGLGLKACVIHKKAALPITALFMYSAMFLPLREYTQVRDAVASTFLIISLFLFYKKYLLYSVLCFLVAISFHLIAFIYIPIVGLLLLLKKEKYWIYLTFLGGGLFFLKPTNIIASLDFLPRQIISYNVIVGQGSILILLFLIGVIFFYKIYESLSKIDSPEMKFYFKLTCLALFFGLITFHHPVLSRLANLLVFFSILLLVNLLSVNKQLYVKYIFSFLLIVAYYLAIRNFTLVTEVV